MSLELKQRMGKFSLFYANQFSLVECNGIMQEAKSRNIKGSALKSICFFEKVLHTFIKVHLPVMWEIQLLVIQTTYIITSLANVRYPVCHVNSVYMTITFAATVSCLFTQQSSMLLYENVSVHNKMAHSLWKITKISTVMWVFENACVICAKRSIPTKSWSPN